MSTMPTATPTAPVSLEALLAALAPNGVLAKALGRMEERAGQRAMLQAVAEAFDNQAVAVLEAGTGTGKTFAYLLPALDWARANQRRVVVATRTIHLQEQILFKDVPALRHVFGDKLRVILAKGRTNYVSLRRLREFEDSLPDLIDDAETADAKTLIRWAYSSQEGSKSDLPFEPRPHHWERIQSEADNCLRQKCPTYHQCFFYKARRALADADLIVANHHLVFADLAVREATGWDDAGILPVYDRLIFDEAHHLEDIATEYLGAQVSRAGVLRHIAHLQREVPKGAKGIIPSLRKRVQSATRRLPAGMATSLSDVLTREVLPALHTVTGAFQTLFDAVWRMALAGTSEGDARMLRLTPNLDTTEVQGLAQALLSTFEPLDTAATFFLRKADPFAEEADLAGYLAEFAATHGRLRAAMGAVQASLLSDDPEMVRWAEAHDGDPRMVRLRCAPIDVGPRLAHTLFDAQATVVMTSATLSAGSTMDFFLHRTGADRITNTHRLRSEVFPSPFDYEHQARLYIVADLPPPDEPTYEDALAEILPRLLEACGGRAFVLFTSFRSLALQHQRAARYLASLNIRCLRQGEGPRHRLIETFRAEPSVLFGTDSFWEGVDVEGEALSTVILTRLPFRVPTHPVVQARCERIEAQGGNAFLQYTVPTAVMKFRQGFGRLIRNRTDRGLVVVTDGRIRTRSYGQIFLRSLPPVPIVSAHASEVETHVRTFFAT